MQPIAVRISALLMLDGVYSTADDGDVPVFVPAPP